MDRIRIIGTLLLGCLLIVSGCRREPLPDVGDGVIRFAVGATMTSSEEPDTKFGLPKDSFIPFVSGEEVMVYARRNSDDPVFDGNSVIWDGSSWNYSPAKYWNWANSTDAYDFLALYRYTPSNVTPSTPSCNFASSPLALSVPYNPASAQYDLMLAGKRRNYNENRLAAVPLEFNHMLCAVEFKVSNTSSGKSFTFEGYHFENLVSRGTAKVTATYDGQGNPAFSWERTRLAASIGGTTSMSAAELAEKDIPYIIASQSDFPVGHYDLMIPQNHNEKIGANGYPTLVVDYTPTGSAQASHAHVMLKDVIDTSTQAPISTWDPGIRYCYEICIDLDGGVQVQATIEPWSNILLETPGLLIPKLTP